jgi:hypothetical protein
LYLGNLVPFNITGCNFSNCRANGANSVGYGSAIYSTSIASGLRYLVNLTFINNIASSGKGNDIAISSTTLFDQYSKASVTGCSSTSSSIKFYSVSYDIGLDCLLTNDCPTNYFYVSSSGVDFPFCGTSSGSCQTLVYICVIYFFVLLFVRNIF